MVFINLRMCDLSFVSILRHSISTVYNLTFIWHFWNNFPMSFLLVGFAENLGLVIATRHSEHEANRAPSAPPNWELERVRKNVNPFWTFGVLLVFPYLQFLVFSTSGNHVARRAYIIAPGDVSDPIVMRWLTSSKFCYYLKFGRLGIFLPYLDFVVHASGYETLRNQIDALVIGSWHEFVIFC